MKKFALLLVSSWLILIVTNIMGQGVAINADGTDFTAFADEDVLVVMNSVAFSLTQSIAIDTSLTYASERTVAMIDALDASIGTVTTEISP